MAFQLTSSAFKHSGSIPAKYTCDGTDVSPDLEWSNPPGNTKSFALICDDPDAPVGTWVHWVLYGLSNNETKLPEGLSKDPELSSPKCKQGINDFRRTGYGGPCPPRGPAHRYFFKLYALNTELNLSSKLSKKELMKAMDGHILGTAELMGVYQRK